MPRMLTSLRSVRETRWKDRHIKITGSNSYIERGIKMLLKNYKNIAFSVYIWHFSQDTE